MNKRKPRFEYYDDKGKKVGEVFGASVKARLFYPGKRVNLKSKRKSSK